jgi:hypothetical protein
MLLHWSTSIYRLYDPITNRIFTSRDVIFKENTFLLQRVNFISLDNTYLQAPLPEPAPQTTPTHNHFIQFHLLYFPQTTWIQKTTITTNPSLHLLQYIQLLQQNFWVSPLRRQFYRRHHQYQLHKPLQFPKTLSKIHVFDLAEPPNLPLQHEKQLKPPQFNKHRGTQNMSQKSPLQLHQKPLQLPRNQSHTKKHLHPLNETFG